jgi:hypothetical protein
MPIQHSPILSPTVSIVSYPRKAYASLAGLTVSCVAFLQHCPPLGFEWNEKAARRASAEALGNIFSSRSRDSRSHAVKTMDDPNPPLPPRRSWRIVLGLLICLLPATGGYWGLLVGVHDVSGTTGFWALQISIPIIGMWFLTRSRPDDMLSLLERAFRVVLGTTGFVILNVSISTLVWCSLHPIHF